MDLTSNYTNTIRIIKCFQALGGEISLSSNPAITDDAFSYLLENNYIEKVDNQHYRLSPQMFSPKVLPDPYSKIQEPLPLNLHGFFGLENWNGISEIIAKEGIETVVELGSWLGQSTLMIGALLPDHGKVYAVDHWKGSLEHQKGSPWHHMLPTLYEQFLSNVIHAQLTEKIIPLKMTTLEAAEHLNFIADLVYVDASHEEEDVYQDLKHWYPKTKILCGDDYTWGKEKGYPVKRALDRFCKEEGLSYTHDAIFWRILPK